MKKIYFLIISLVVLTACTDSGLDTVSRTEEITVTESLCQDWGRNASYVKSKMTSFGLLSEGSDALLFQGKGDSMIAYGFVSDSLVSACIIYDHLIDKDKLGLSEYSYLGIVDECDVYQASQSFAFVFEMTSEGDSYSIVGFAPKVSAVLPDYVPVSITSKEINVTGYNTTSISFKTTGLTADATAKIQYSLEPDLSSPSSKTVAVGENGEGKFDLTSLKMNKKYYAMLFVTVDNLTYTGDYLNFTTLNAEEGTTNGYKWVNLGLPSGTLWATKDVGASTEGEYGYHYAWGALSTSWLYDYGDYVYYEGTFYGNVQFTNIGYEISGDKKYDVATYKWGSPWRMPNKTECEELVNNCHVEISSSYFKIIGPNGKYIIFPKSGYLYGGDEHYYGSSYYCWSSTLYNNKNAYYITHESDSSTSLHLYGPSEFNNRIEGYVVRPVVSL